MGNGDDVGVPVGSGIGSVRFERVVSDDGTPPVACGAFQVKPAPLKIRLIPGTVLMVLSTVMKLRRAPSYAMPYPVRRTVLPFPNHGTFQDKPRDGAKLL